MVVPDTGPPQAKDNVSDLDRLDEFGFSWVVLPRAIGHDASLDIKLPCGSENQASLELPSANAHRSRVVVVAFDTGTYRRCAARLVEKTDHVLEIGSCLGQCTEILHRHSESVVGYDVSQAYLTSCRRRLSNIRFEFLDLFEETSRLAASADAQRCSAAFVDIGGDRRVVQVLQALDILRGNCLPKLRLLVVKSEELHAALSGWPLAPHESSGGVSIVEHPCRFLSAQHSISANPSESVGAAAKPYSLCTQKKRATRCRRAAAHRLACDDRSLVPAGSDANRKEVLVPRFEVEAKLSQCSLKQISGFFRTSFGGLLEAVTAVVTSEANQPLLRRLGVACVYGGKVEAESLVAAASHAVPVFLGPTGGVGRFEFVGSFCAERVLSKDDALYKDALLLCTLDSLALRSRRGRVDVYLLKLRRVDGGVDVDTRAAPKTPLEVPNRAVWAATILRRSLVSLCWMHWSSMREGGVERFKQRDVNEEHDACTPPREIPFV
eukprot:TRINITY_DN64005_c0_g1_i1.p1 TRINITY_DN64005_c0_g1~~TRINITY_DN64005_c0_g1_i1.p1  ORF type:complete len:508 (+),score=64.93 TRINITY_DN64005_c0_g1_i1:45-1526(+)